MRTLLWVFTLDSNATTLDIVLQTYIVQYTRALATTLTTPSDIWAHGNKICPLNIVVYHGATHS